MNPDVIALLPGFNHPVGCVKLASMPLPLDTQSNQLLIFQQQPRTQMNCCQLGIPLAGRLRAKGVERSMLLPLGVMLCCKADDSGIKDGVCDSKARHG